MKTTIAALKKFLGNAPARRVPMPRTFKLRVDDLEDRRLLAVSTFIVDDSFASDNVALRRYNTIQEAVDAAKAGDIIKVNAGTYAENVVVNKKLSIIGNPTTLARAENPQFAAIVDPIDDGVGGSPGIGFLLQANDIAITGFTIAEFDADADADGTVGISTSNLFSGYKIAGNLIENNSIGIYLNTSTASNAKASVVSANTIRNNNEGFGVAAAAGNGIYSDAGARNVSITGNCFGGQQNEDVIFVAPSGFVQTKITVQANVHTDSSGILFINVNNSTIQANKITRSLYNAIELAGNNSKVTVQANILTNVGTLGYNGIFVHDSNADGPFGPNTNNTIQANIITNAGLSGIVIRDSSNNTIKANTVTGSIGFDLSDPNWGNGISLQNATGNRIESNILRGNARNGLAVDATSTGNTIKSNTSQRNAVLDPTAFDYFDESVGAGTAGTANTYTTNKGRTQNVVGLIRTII